MQENRYASLSNQFASIVMTHNVDDKSTLPLDDVREILRVSRSDNLREKQEYLYNFLKRELSTDDKSPYTDFNFSVNRVKIVSKH